jgi:hypothetical protein
VQYFKQGNCYRSESLQQEFTVSSPTAWGNEKFVQSGLHMTTTQAAMYVLATAHLQHWENEDDAFLNCMLMIDEPWMISFDAQLK